MSKNDFLRPGFISFKSVPGALKYILSFKEGTGKVAARTNPSVRAWWVELSTDPELKQNHEDSWVGYYYGKKIKNMPDGMYSDRGIIRIYSKFFPLVDKRVCGRDITCYSVFDIHSLEQGKNLGGFSFPLRNFRNTRVIGFFLERVVEPGTYAVYIEGTVTNDPAKVWIDGFENKYTRNISFYINGKFTVRQFRIQSPPCNAGVRLKYRSPALLKGGDTIRFDADNLNREVFQEMKLTTDTGIELYGACAENWSENHGLQIQVRDAAGKIVQTIDSLSGTLANLPAGNYTVTGVAASKDKKLTIAEKTAKIKIITPPQW